MNSKRVRTLERKVHALEVEVLTLKGIVLNLLTNFQRDLQQLKVHTHASTGKPICNTNTQEEPATLTDLLEYINTNKRSEPEHTENFIG